MFRLGFFVSIIFVNCGVLATLNARAWRSSGAYPTAADFPETELLKNKPNTAIAFSGGGSRAYTAAMGYLAGLRDLDLLKNVRYIGGISGGAWATTTFTFVQNVTDDNVFLGKIVQPADIKYEELKEMDPACARSLSYKELTLIAIQALKDKVVDSVGAAWSYAVSKTYLEPVGIMPNKRFSWNANTVSDIKKRNSQLANEDFTIPVAADRPFPVIGTTLVGPIDGAPFTSKTQNYSLMEFTPMYVGQMMNLDIDFKYKGIGLSHTKHVGGMLEPFAFARTGGDAPLRGIPSRKTTDVLSVPEPENFVDLQFAAGSVSYAPGSFFESIGIPEAAAALSMQFNYWSPDDSFNPDFTTMMYADGGCYENMPLIPFMQRRVPKITLFSSPRFRSCPLRIGTSRPTPPTKIRSPMTCPLSLVCCPKMTGAGRTAPSNWSATRSSPPPTILALSLLCRRPNKSARAFSRRSTSPPWRILGGASPPAWCSRSPSLTLAVCRSGRPNCPRKCTNLRCPPKTRKISASMWIPDHSRISHII